MNYTIKVKGDNILLTQREFTIFLKGLADVRKKNDEKLTANYIAYLRNGNSIENLIKNKDIKPVSEQPKKKTTKKKVSKKK